MAKFQRHVFVCTNQRAADDPRGCCKATGGDAVAEAFKEKLHARGFKRVVRPNKAGCLDQCAFGCVVVVYPDAVWYGHVTPADVDEIIESHFVGGKPVERLVIPSDKLTGLDPNAAPSGAKGGKA
ncbi:MAG: (2Fe-2S) ferredoxin domain-containing protein [Planctomycetes bacterium]|nr:(2Fe-2S) ferredoxin domain-containing protein [Planctomycetota bacterium]